MEKRYIGGDATRKIKHSPTIENEVRQSLFADLSGIMANLGYKEKELPAPDQNKIDFYSKVARALWEVKDKWWQFTDDEIKVISAPVSRLIKAFTGAYEKDNQIIADNHNYFVELINPNLVSK